MSARLKDFFPVNVQDSVADASVPKNVKIKAYVLYVRPYILSGVVYDDQESWMRVRQEFFHEVDIYEHTFKFNTKKSICDALSWWMTIPCGEDCWMDANMGYMVATQYNKLFVLLSPMSPQTYLPLTKDDSISIDGEIVIFFIRNHFIILETMNFSLPPIPVDWSLMCKDFVSHLPKLYQSRLQKYLHLRGLSLIQNSNFN
ncbi:hypothetical protein LIER_03919 [Lithospermum erythrorhizon]|uniref:Uncharacterized protein n=1 Tax=Lithospermum erythrorhizon TaxID=34254 RepID=A0AAV3NUU1_LITER